METDWLRLWRELVTASPHDQNSVQVQRYKTYSNLRRERVDPLLDFIIQSIDRETTVLDIGASNGRWTIPLSKIAKNVTAIEPSQEMFEELQKNTRIAQVKIRSIKSSWEEADVEAHDIIVCAHAMYTSSDLALFVRKMEQHAGRNCYMALRLPPGSNKCGRKISPNGTNGNMEVLRR